MSDCTVCGTRAGLDPVDTRHTPPPGWVAGAKSMYRCSCCNGTGRHRGPCPGGGAPRYRLVVDEFVGPDPWEAK